MPFRAARCPRSRSPDARARAVRSAFRRSLLGGSADNGAGLEARGRRAKAGPPRRGLAGLCHGLDKRALVGSQAVHVALAFDLRLVHRGALRRPARQRVARAPGRGRADRRGPLGLGGARLPRRRARARGAEGERRAGGPLRHRRRGAGGVPDALPRGGDLAGAGVLARAGAGGRAGAGARAGRRSELLGRVGGSARVAVRDSNRRRPGSRRSASRPGSNPGSLDPDRASGVSFS
jgi:hypothetical protein